MVVFDVGANVGDWTKLAARLLPGATVHAFEPVRSTHTVAVGAVRDLGERVVLNDFGLSDCDGHLDMFVDPERSTVASTMSSMRSVTTSAVTCAFTTGDDYCSCRDIDRIDMLKIDTEGADHLVLAGFGVMLERAAVRVVQFEHGPWSIESHSLLADKYRYLEAFGYAVGRLFPDGVEFRPHSRSIEDFRLANYVAVRVDDPIRDQLAAPR
jgi:FkbM family methyltransferase